MATTTNLNTLKINYLTQAQYETALGNNQINENELYFTPNNGAISGAVTSVAASGSGGITISGSPITTSGTIAVGLDLSTAINGLSEGASPAQLNDYIVAQYAGGGTTTTTYHRRKLSNVIVGKAVADQNGLTINTGYLKLTGGNVTGSTSFGNSVSIDSATLGNLIVNGKATFNGEISSITFSKDSDIYYAGPYATQRMIRFINGPDIYGHGISIGGGGLAVFGSGESSNTILSSLSLTASGGNETTYIGSDGSIIFYPSINSWDAAAAITMTAGKIWVGVNGNTTRENQIGVQSGAGQLYMWSAAATTGSRGIWTPAHGTGTSKAIINVDTNNNATFNGTVSSTSDKKSKDILGIITNAKELILNLKPTHYMWKDGDHRRIHMGFVAQDVAATCKKLNKNLALVVAHYKNNEDRPYYGEDIDDSLLNWGLNYQELIAPIVSVIQEQEQEIQQLKQQLSSIQQYLNLIK